MVDAENFDLSGQCARWSAGAAGGVLSRLWRRARAFGRRGLEFPGDRRSGQRRRTGRAQFTWAAAASGAGSSQRSGSVVPDRHDACLCRSAQLDLARLVVMATVAPPNIHTIREREIVVKRAG